MVVIDMTNLETRKRVVVLTAIHRLRLEVRGIRFHPPSILRVMREAWGFKARTRKGMLVELEAWDAEHGLH